MAGTEIDDAQTRRAGGIPVPIYPPARPEQLEDHLRRHAGILDNAGALLLITVPEALTVARLLRAWVPSLRGIVRAGGRRGVGAASAPSPASQPDDIAFIQYTSGSTGQPKGVMLSHANLLANIRAMGEAVEAGPDDVFVSWLPLYHDMGLIGAWLGSLYFGVPLVSMSPLAFLARPRALAVGHPPPPRHPVRGAQLRLRAVPETAPRRRAGGAGSRQLAPGASRAAVCTRRPSHRSTAWPRPRSGSPFLRMTAAPWWTASIASASPRPAARCRCPAMIRGP